MNKVQGPGGVGTPSPPGRPTTYTVQRGDTLSEIARRNNLSLPELIRRNPQIKDPNRIEPGQVLNLPEPATYTVQRGDTMSRIAREHHIGLQDLIRANPQIANPDRIYPNQVIHIPMAQQPHLAPAPPDQFERPRPNVIGQALGHPQTPPPSSESVDRQARGSAVNDLEQAAARQGAPLTRAEQQRLESRLNNLHGTALQNEIQFLRDHVLGSPNADRALRTYLDLRDIQDRHPSRINDDIVHTLTRGVADRRTQAAAGAEGILGRTQALDAANALARMPQSEYQRVRTLLNQAGTRNGHPVSGADPQVERALILKAVAARRDELQNPGFWDRARMWFGKPSRSMNEIEQYAGQIRGMKRAQLIERSTVLDLDGDAQNEALQQRFSTSCTPTSQQMARAESDPIYAWRLHQEAINSTATTGNIADEQRNLLEGAGGRAVARGQAGGVGAWPEATLNNTVGPYTNRTYSRHDVANTSQDRATALDRIDSNLRSGVDVPIVVQWDSSGSHSMVISDVRGSGNNRQYLITDPWTGKTGWISRQDIVNGHTNFMCGTGRLWVTYE